MQIIKRNSTKFSIQSRVYTQQLVRAQGKCFKGQVPSNDLKGKLKYFMKCLLYLDINQFIKALVRVQNDTHMPLSGA